MLPKRFMTFRDFIGFSSITYRNESLLSRTDESYLKISFFADGSWKLFDDELFSKMSLYSLGIVVSDSRAYF